MSEKMAKRVRRLEARVTELEGQSCPAWDASMGTAVREIARKDAERSARRQVRKAERTATQWEHLTYAILIGCIICLILANMAVHAKADDAKNTPDFATPAVQAEANDEIAEDFENELIEAALLARSHFIEDCVVTHYDCCIQCCGKDDGITASGVRATPGVTVAVDPAVIPLGADVLADYGDGELHYYRADDVGVKGNHIDLCVGSHEEALQLGRQTATVYWVEED